jgi:hypothetical protein
MAIIHRVGTNCWLVFPGWDGVSVPGDYGSIVLPGIPWIFSAFRWDSGPQNSIFWKK